MADIAPDFYLLAHSHGVSLLDGMTDWRTTLSKNFDPDPRYGQAFQGWFKGAIPRYPVHVSVVRGAPSLRRIVVWIMSQSTGIGPLVRPLKPSSAAPLELQVNPEYVQVLQSWRGTIPIVSMIHGWEHVGTILNQWPPYDFLEEELPSIESGVPIIDEKFIDERVEPWVAAVFAPLAVLRQVASNPLAHVLPPPPRESPQNSEHSEGMVEGIARFGFASNQLRLKWYKRYCRVLSTRLTTIGCDVLSPSPQACNSEGLLSEDYAGGLTHGNDRYGMLTAHQVESWLHGPRA